MPEPAKRSKTVSPHRLRKVYKPSNLIANTLKNALAQKNKLLLTATPLQNSLLELYGLVSFIDEHAFGDVKSFREQLANPGDKRGFEALKERLKPICHRTLRRQVTAYTLDDNEAHYLKVMADEIFGRQNFLANVIWEKADSPRMDARFFSSRHDHLLIFAKDISSLKINHVSSEYESAPLHYNKLDDKGRRYYLKPLRAMA